MLHTSVASAKEGTSAARSRRPAARPEVSARQLAMQDALGNRGALALMQQLAGRRQPAAPVVTPAGQGVQRACGCSGSATPCPSCAEEAEELELQRRALDGAGGGGTVSASVLPAGGGVPLDGFTRRFMEGRLGRDLGAVRVHADSAADRAARAVGAVAFTAGQDVYFAAGRYRPESPAGRGLLAHELVHTLQQGSGRVAPSPSARLRVNQGNDPWEQEAERIAARVMAGEPAVAPAPAPARGMLQRLSLGDVWPGGETLLNEAGEAISGAAGAVADTASAAVDTVVDTAGAVVEGVTDLASSAAGAVSSLPGMPPWLRALAGVTIRRVGTGWQVDFPPIPLFESVQQPVVTLPAAMFYVPLFGGVLPVPLPAAGAVGLEATIQPQLMMALGPGELRGVHLLVDITGGVYEAAGTLYVAAACGPRYTVFGGLSGRLLLVLPTEPPLPVLVGLKGGLRGTGSGWAIGARQVAVALVYTGGVFNFNLIDDLMLGVLLQGDLDLQVALTLYEKVICQYISPLAHWETGEAWKLTLPIVASYGPGGPAGRIGPITHGPIPVTDIETAIEGLEAGLDCLGIEDIIAYLCEIGILPPEACPEEDDEEPGTLAKRKCFAGRNCTGRAYGKKFSHCHNCKNAASGKSLGAYASDPDCENC